MRFQLNRCGLWIVAFGHKSSKSDIAAHMDRTGEVWILEGSALGPPSCSWPRREALSSHQVDREQLRHQWLQSVHSEWFR